MIQLPFRRPGRNPTIRALYGMIVAQARAAGFYRDLGVADDVPGRIEMIMLHLALVLRRLRRDETQTRQVRQDLFDLFCQDMDDNFRELGVGDLAVPKEMRRVAEAFYGRSRVYDAALDDTASDEALLAAVARNVRGGPVDAGVAAIAAYIRQAEQVLAVAPTEQVLAAQVALPEPAADVALAPAGKAD